MISIELLPTAIAFQPRRGLELQVRLHNSGAPVDLANPAALRAAPSWRLAPWPDGHGRVIGNQQGYAPPRGEPERLTLANGDGWAGTVEIIDDHARVGPGDWSVSLLLAVHGTTEESPPCRVRVAEWCIEGADAAYGVPRFPRQEGDSLLMQSGQGARTLYRMPWQESHGDRLGHGGAQPIPLLAVGPDAADPLVPVRDGPFFGDTARWLLWREGATVHAFNSSGRRVALALPEPPFVLVRPALQRSGQEIVVLALSAKRDRLLRLGFPRTDASSARVDGEVALPFVAAAATAVFAPGEGVLAAVSGESAGAVALAWVSPDGAMPTRVATLASATLIPAAPPAVLIGDDGGTLVGALVITADGMGLAEARFPLEPSLPPTITLRPLGTDLGTPVRGAVLYRSAAAHGAPEHGEADNHPSQSPSTHVVIGLADGSLLALNEAGGLQPVVFEAPPVPGLVLVPGAHCAFLLCCDPVLGPFMAEV